MHSIGHCDNQSIFPINSCKSNHVRDEVTHPKNSHFETALNSF